MTDKVKTEERGAIRILRINRPEQRNAVDGETAVGLGQAIEAFAASERARVLVVTGEGELSFCAGADLKNTTTLFGHDYTDKAGPMGFARLDPSKPTIAAVSGPAVAGGMELALWCDIRVMEEDAYSGSTADAGASRCWTAGPCGCPGWSARAGPWRSSSLGARFRPTRRCGSGCA